MSAEASDAVCSSSQGVKRKAPEVFTDSDGESNAVLLSEDELETGDDVCRIVSIPVRTKPIIGFQIMKPNSVKPRETNATSIHLNTNLKERDFQENFRQHFSNGTPVRNEFCKLIIEPWKVCVINNILNDDSILYDVRQEFYELDWNTRKMDLYDFHQSLDLKHVDSENIKIVYNFLKDDVLPWVSDLMDLELRDISATCSFYSDTDYLLVHDDRQEDRVVAFVLYISDVWLWQKSWGGALQLLSHDANCLPNKSVKNIYPAHNQLVLFPVSSVSYHQVEEVVTKNFCRYSINGWFHGTVKNIDKLPKYISSATGIFSNVFSKANISDIELSTWISASYLAQYHIEDIQGQIEEHSEISLPHFFQQEKFDQVCKDLEGATDKWKIVGPSNRFRYEVLQENDFPVNLKELIGLFRSHTMFYLLQEYTELELSGTTAGIKYEVQKWTPGCYSLLSDYDWQKKKELELIIYFGCENIVGGQTQYITEDEEVQQSLITLIPQNNTLNIVFRDSARITCHVSKHTEKPFYALICSYVENRE